MTITSTVWTTISFPLAEKKSTETDSDGGGIFRKRLGGFLSASYTGKRSHSLDSSTRDAVVATPERQQSADCARSGEVAMVTEKTPLLEEHPTDGPSPPQNRSQVPFVKRIASAIIGATRFIIAALAAPGTYVIACFYDDNGHFSAALPVKRLAWTTFGKRRKSAIQATEAPMKLEREEKKTEDERPRLPLQRRSSRYSRSPVAGSAPPRPSGSTGADRERSRRSNAEGDSPSQHTRSKASLDEVAENSEGSSLAPTRPTRIRIINQDTLRHRRHRRATIQDMDESSAKSSSREPSLTVDTIKSPTSPTSASRLTKYPHTPIPPRPLVPRRQPSYTLSAPSSDPPQKTLVLDLDETLIHSMAKGGRMSTGHMVEVKLDSPVGAGGGMIGPQVPILYYVHKRPHCDDFLRKVSKWYNLIVFTASVQEYADPVIDWLELERKYFSARYYRQHCTYRSGAYIKDLSTVEPDLSKVMILDNSPLSYIFHEDNAIPIEGWISDPTDSDLLHLIPFLEGLQYTTDVRSLLSLRSGEPSAL